MLLEGRRLLITGVLTEGSIAYSVARRAQEEGAEIVLTGFGRGLRITQRIAKRLGDPPPDVLELDVNEPDQLAAVAADLEQRWGALDGVLHAIAFAPGDALGGDFLGTPAEIGADRVHDERVLDEGARRRDAAAAREGRARVDRRPGLRRDRRLAGV